MPPLRDKKEDIPDLVNYLLGKTCAALEIAKPKVSPEAMDMLKSHSWKGNVRELKNVLQRCLVFNEPTTIRPDDLELPDVTATSSTPNQNLLDRLSTTEIGKAPVSLSMPIINPELPFTLPVEGISLEDVEKSFLVQALERSRYNQSKACLLLGISRHALRYRLEKFGLTD